MGPVPKNGGRRRWPLIKIAPCQECESFGILTDGWQLSGWQPNSCDVGGGYEIILRHTPLRAYKVFVIICGVKAKWQVEFTDEFGEWWHTLSIEAREKIYKVVSLLEEHGPTLGFPYSSDIKGSNIAMRELRTQQGKHPYRILYAFDPERTAILLIGGDKTGDARWYEQMVPFAEQIYRQYLNEIQEERR